MQYLPFRALSLRKSWQSSYTHSRRAGCHYTRLHGGSSNHLNYSNRRTYLLEGLEIIDKHIKERTLDFEKRGVPITEAEFRERKPQAEVDKEYASWDLPDEIPENMTEEQYFQWLSQHAPPLKDWFPSDENGIWFPHFQNYGPKEKDEKELGDPNTMTPDEQQERLDELFKPMDETFMENYKKYLKTKRPEKVSKDDLDEDSYIEGLKVKEKYLKSGEGYKSMESGIPSGNESFEMLAKKAQDVLNDPKNDPETRNPETGETIVNPYYYRRIKPKNPERYVVS